MGSDPAAGLPAIPGGGRVLYYEGDEGEAKVGVVGPDGTKSEFGIGQIDDATWDPLVPGAVLVNSELRGSNTLREYVPLRGRWTVVHSWRGGIGPYLEISSDGNSFAYDVFVHGAETGTIRATRRNGTVSELHASRLEPVSWTPEGGLILTRRGSAQTFLWDAASGTVRSFRLGWNLRQHLPEVARSLYLDLDDLSWSSDSRYFAVSASWYVGSEPRNGIAVGTPSGAIIKMIPTGRAAPSAPTWSPREPEFAYVSSLELGDRRSGLFIYDAVTGRQEAIMRHPPAAWWVAWSPQGVGSCWMTTAPGTATGDGCSYRGTARAP